MVHGMYMNIFIKIVSFIQYISILKYEFLSGDTKGICQQIGLCMYWRIMSFKIREIVACNRIDFGRGLTLTQE
jgi:hypothetical protein